MWDSGRRSCVGVRSFILTGAACHKSCGKAVPFGTISVNRITGRVDSLIGTCPVSVYQMG